MLNDLTLECYCVDSSAAMTAMLAEDAKDQSDGTDAAFFIDPSEEREPNTAVTSRR
jgi:hypothetical protein